MNKSNISLEYQGKVKVSLAHNKKIVSTKTYHNAGGAALYEFLLNSITGGYKESRKPSYIRLFTNENVGTYSEDIVIDENSMPVCAGIYYNQVSGIEDAKDGDTVVGKSVCLHFTIPCSYLNTSNGNINIKQAGLYCSDYNNDNNKKNYSACFNFIATPQGSSSPSWDPIIVNSSQGDYNIFIEWTLILK